MSRTRKNHAKAVAVFKGVVEGEVVFFPKKNGVTIKATFTKLPKGKHGFHIHKAGDLRGEGCKGACEHYDVGNHCHGGVLSKEHHTGDLGNIEMKYGTCKKTYTIKNTSVKELWGRSLIVHADEDDLGKGNFPDSKITGHSGARMACVIIGRT
jgi:superoxide dismutase, Cu-Zn family